MEEHEQSQGDITKPDPLADYVNFQKQLKVIFRDTNEQQTAQQEIEKVQQHG